MDQPFPQLTFHEEAGLLGHPAGSIVANLCAPLDEIQPPGGERPTTDCAHRLRCDAVSTGGRCHPVANLSGGVAIHAQSNPSEPLTSSSVLDQELGSLTTGNLLGGQALDEEACVLHEVRRGQLHELLQGRILGHLEDPRDICRGELPEG
jgi:hypothetical protein